ncbi:MAG: hypothetical protein D8M59_11555 [Planctomycetes bacterium]|nr:hypothetical protein [Planctomycetota bacterium]NOG55397.1 hypothetical protein [Planctomycetota bacterium]
MIERTNNPTALLAAALATVGLCASPASAGDLYAADVSTNALWIVDRDTADCTIVGGFNSLIQGLAYDANHDIMYGISASFDCIFTINRTTGRATSIGGTGALGYDNANGLAYDPNHDILYATDNNTNTLMWVDTTTGVGHAIGTIGGGFREIEGLGYDPYTDTLFGLTDLDQCIVSIDVNTADAVAVSGDIGDYVWRGLTFDTERRGLWATQVDPYGNPDPRGLWFFDPATGIIEMVGETDELGSPQGLTFVGSGGSGFAVAVDGNCPGDIRITAGGAEPGDRIAVIYGLNAGQTHEVPGCPGLYADIAKPNIADVGTADAQGEFVVTGRAPAKACGRLLIQAINLTACEASNVVNL